MKNSIGLKRLLLTGAGLLALGASPVFASAVCPIPNSGNSGTEAVDATYLSNAATQGGCNVLITFGLAGAVTTSFPNAQGFYDAGADDNLIGIINNSGASIAAISLNSGSSIFGFENDGICGTPGYGFTTGTYAVICAGSDATGYGGPGVTFAINNANSGVANFAGGIADGGTAWFSLEGPVDINTAATNGAPEPASIALLGGGLSALYFVRRRRKT